MRRVVTSFLIILFSGVVSGGVPLVHTLVCHQEVADSIRKDENSFIANYLRRKDFRSMLFPAYNDNDEWMAGLALTNLFSSHRKQIAYFIAPTYSFSLKKVLGVASFQFQKAVNHSKISKFFSGLTVRSFDMQNSRSMDFALIYTLIRPFAGVIFKSKKNPDMETKLTFSASLIAEEEAIFSSSGALEGTQIQKSDIYRLQFNRRWNRNGKIQGYSIMAEQQTYGEDHYLKLAAVLNYSYPYLKNRFVYLRFFGAGFPVNTRRNSFGFQNAFTRGTIAMIYQGFNDYTYQETFFSRRNQDRTYDNQVSLEEGGGFKTPLGSAYNTGMTNHLAASVSWSADVPFSTGPVDLRVYFDAGVYYVPEKDGLKNKPIYNGGISLHYQNVCSIHLPLLFGKDLGNDFREVHASVLSRISFSLQLEKLLFGSLKNWEGL